jgi:hypothetical protein
MLRICLLTSQYIQPMNRRVGRNSSSVPPNDTCGNRTNIVDVSKDMQQYSAVCVAVPVKCAMQHL